MAGRSASSSSAGTDALLPRVQCSQCDLKVIGGICTNERNRGRAYYKCPNYNGWEDEYRGFLCELEKTEGGAPLTEVRNKSNDLEKDKSKNLCVVLSKLIDVLDRLNLLLTAVVVLLLVQVATKYFQ